MHNQEWGITEEKTSNSINIRLQEKRIFEYILQTATIRSYFQPIISLRTGEVAGYEALSRGPEGNPLEFPDKLFSVAKEHNMLWDLERLCRSKSIERIGKLNKDQFLFINVDPDVINDPAASIGLCSIIKYKYAILSEEMMNWKQKSFHMQRFGGLASVFWVFSWHLLHTMPSYP